MTEDTLSYTVSGIDANRLSRGTPAVQTTVRYMQMTRAQVKEKLKALKG